jgi:hypothetical protein
MSENAIDSENINKPAPDEAKPKAAQSGQEGEARKEFRPGQEGGQQAERDRTNKKAEVIAMMKRANARRVRRNINIRQQTNTPVP